MNNSSQYRKEIDGLRAIAVIAVVINHIWGNLLPSGFLGVDIFFIISGYVVTSSITAKEYDSYKTLLTSFYAKRVKRLLPALYTVVFIFSTLSLFVIVEPKESLKTGMYSLFGSSNLFLLFNDFDYFSEGSSLNLFTHTWSLGVEEQFYLIFPLLLSLFGLISVSHSRNKKDFALPTLFLMSLIFYIFFYFYNTDIAFYFLLSRFWQLSLGSLVYFYGKKEKVTSYLSNLLASLTILLILVLLFTPPQFQIYSTLGISFLTAFLLFIIRNKEIDLGLKSKIAQTLGEHSYSIYLWHWPLIVVFKHTVGIRFETSISLLLLIFITSFLSYRFIETPLRYANWGSNKKTIKIGLTISVFLIATNWAYYKVIQDRLSLTVEVPYANNNLNYYNHNKCVINDKIKDFHFDKLESCLIGKKKGDRTIWVYGDSYAEQLIPAFYEINKATNYSIVLFSSPGCPIWEDEFHHKGSPLRCKETLKHFLDQINIKSKKADIVIFSNSPFYFDALNSFKEGDHFLSGEQLIKAYNEHLKNIQSLLNQEGLSFFVTSGIPTTKNSPRSCQQRWSKNRIDCFYEQLINVDDFRKIKDISKQIYEDIYVLDLFTPLLQKIERDRNIASYFYNKDHLSTEGAILLKDDIIFFLSDK